MEKKLKIRIGTKIKSLRKKKNLTLTDISRLTGVQLATLSRIENDASDIRLSTLMKIIQQGLGGHLKLTLQL